MNRRHMRAAGVSVLLTFLSAVLGASAAAQSRPAPEISEVAVSDGKVSFTVDAGPLPGGEQVDPGSVTVTVDGEQWAATASPVDASNSTVPRSAVLVVDTSGSMGEQGIRDARTAANAFLDAAPADVAVGLVTFSAQPQLVVPPGEDRAAVRAGLDAMRPGGNTALYDAVAVALEALGPDGDRAMIVLSDGEDTASTSNLEATRDALTASGVASHLVAFKTEDSQVDVLHDLAAPSQGVVLEAANGEELAGVFAASARTLVNKVAVEAEIPQGAEGGEASLVVTLAAGAVTLTGSAIIPVPAPAPVTLDVASLPATAATPAQGAWVQPAVVVTAFAGMFVLFVVLLAPSTWKRSASGRRTHDIQRYALSAGAATATAATATPGAVSQAALGWAERRVQKGGLEDGWQLLLDRAALPLKPNEWLVLRLAAALVGVAVAVVLLPWWALTGPLFGVLTWLLTGVFLKVKAARRARKFAEELPDVLQLVAGSLSSGFSFPQAIDNAATEGQDPIAAELARALTETRLGIQLEDALERVATRMASTDLSWTVMAVRISREVGGNLGEVLLSTAETMRERGRIRRQVKALSAEGKLSAYILIGLPVALALWMAAFRPGYVAPLVTHPLGLAMTAAAVISMSIGAWWMSRLIKLEV